LSRLAGAAIRRRLGQPVSLFIAKPPFTERLETLRSLADDGRVVPPVDRVYRLEETAAAIRQIERGRVRGKLVIRT
jgi:NADPH:quinone reductase-like Zn-dependent oxidoreductase